MSQFLLERPSITEEDAPALNNVSVVVTGSDVKKITLTACNRLRLGYFLLSRMYVGLANIIAFQKSCRGVKMTIRSTAQNDLNPDIQSAR
mmetsp:Transcript_24303/g.38136  ORF Transcript_24303/g.38136 Transcript_24303/m.38136 type:complete len:90 (+) Transcript_24303:379-648(+)